MNMRFHQCCLVVLLLCVAGPAQSQEEHPSAFEVQRLQFIGNDHFDDEDLLEVMFERETPGSFSQFLYNLFGDKLGSKPEYFDPNLLILDIGRLKTFYQERGYFDVRIRDSVAIDSSEASCSLTLLIEENRPSAIDNMKYVGLEQLPSDIAGQVYGEPRIEAGNTFEQARVIDEITRVLHVLENGGYPTARYDRERSSVTRVLSTGRVSVVMAFTTGHRLRFGSVSVIVDPPREDITDDIVLRQLDFEPKEIYSVEKRISSERNVNRLGIFEAARIDATPTAEAESTGIVPVQVAVRPRDKHELSPGLTVSDENNAFNLGLGVGYTNRNFFGDARIFNAQARFRTQSIQDWNFESVFSGAGLRDPSVLGALELQFSLAQPYLFTRSLSGTWSFLLSAEKQNLYVLPIVRNKMGVTDRFSETTYGFLEWTLERVSVQFLEDTTANQDIVSRMREEERPQFNSILSLTLQQDKTNDIFSPSQGHLRSVTLEESGVLPTVLKGVQPDLPFTQFYKIVLLGKWYEDVTHTRYNIYAFKFRTGYQDKYGESRRDSSIRIPLNRRFFGGGSGSVRGWKSRDLGAMPDDELQFGGNFMLEGSYEMRINYFRGFGKLWFMNLDNFWIVYFLDAGNVWSDLATFKTKDIALAAGLGIRYETLFGPFRVDFGFRIYDPKENAGKQWIFQKRFFGDILSNGVLHFGLGHAF